MPWQTDHIHSTVRFVVAFAQQRAKTWVQEVARYCCKSIWRLHEIPIPYSNFLQDLYKRIEQTNEFHQTPQTKTPSSPLSSLLSSQSTKEAERASTSRCETTRSGRVPMPLSSGLTFQQATPAANARKAGRSATHLICTGVPPPRPPAPLPTSPPSHSCRPRASRVVGLHAAAPCA